MQLTRALLAGVAAGVVGIFTSWFLTGFLFHPYQRLTPTTWRPAEGPRHYALGSATTVLAALVIALFFAITGGVPAIAGPGWVANGLLFGVLCWASLAVPVLLSMSIFVNVHSAVITGLLLDWLVVSVLAALASAWAILR